MKQILNINLGGHPVTIDTDAYEHLSRYLDTIEKHFRESDAAEEILSDIETRMAELFRENIQPRTIVTMPDVKSAIDIMGTPEMFGAELIDDEDPVGQQKKSKSDSGFNPGKRLFRDPEQKLLGGVSSGLAAYLGVADPIWIRIAFLLFTFAGFASVPVYLILWIVMPVAKTSTDRLAMKGEPINVESIASSVVEELEHFSEKLNTQFGKKKKSGGRSKIKRGWITSLGGVLSAILVGITSTARPVLKLLGGLIIMVLIIGWIGLVTSAIVGVTKASFFLPSNAFAFTLGMGGLFFVVGAPIMGLILTTLRVFFKRSNSVGLRWTLVGLWILGLFGLSFSAAKISDNYDEQSTYKQTTLVSVQKDAPLRVQYEKVFLANNDARTLSLYGKIEVDWVKIKLDIKPSHDGSYKLVQVQKARGSDYKDATQGAETFEYRPFFEGNTLKIPSDYFIPKGERFRVQEVAMTLYVPVGQKVILDKRLRKLDLHISKSGKLDDIYDEELTMGDGGFTSKSIVASSIGLVKENTQVLSLNDFTSIDVQGPTALNVQQGAVFRVKVRGVEDGDPIDMTVKDGGLVIHVAPEMNKEVEVFITMPNLERLTANTSKEINVTNFSGDEMEVFLDGEVDMKLIANVEKLMTNMRGKAKLLVEGSTEELEAILVGEATLNGKEFNADRADVDVRENALIEVNVANEFQHYGG